jgi:CPA2 family monovalent cation:H+ antiporter-2
VVFLMFSVGLEVQPAAADGDAPHGVRLRRRAGGRDRGARRGGAMLAGESWRAGLVVGGVLAMSSTAIISKMLVERAQLHSPARPPDHGRAALPGPRR